MKESNQGEKQIDYVTQNSLLAEQQKIFQHLSAVPNPLPPAAQYIHKISKTLKQVKKRIQKYGLVYLIFLLGSSFFESLSKWQVQKLNDENSRDAMEMLVMCQIEHPRFMDIQSKKSKNFVDRMKKNQPLYNQVKASLQKKTKQNSQLNFFMQQIFKALKEAKDSKQLTLAIQISFRVKRPKTEDLVEETLHEYSTNYLKFFLQRIRLKTKPKTICCKPIYFMGQQLKQAEGPNQEFKRYIWPISSPNLIFHLRKTIAAFMNGKGGIIYIGIQQSTSKKNQVVGVALTQTQVKQMKGFLSNEIVGNIHPKHKQFNNHSEQNEDEKDKKWQVENQYIKIYEINSYISVQFVPVTIDAKSFTAAYQAKETANNKCLYIVKIVVRIGHPKHLYHLITSENIEFFERNDRNVQKLPFPQAYDQIYSKLRQYDKIKVSKQVTRAPFHTYCQYPMDKITINIDSDEDSDDEYDEKD